MEPPPRLRNLGNTCYMNAALQCILALQPLYEYFESSMMESDVAQCTVGKDTERALALKFVYFIRKIKDRTQVYAPTYLKETIDACLPVFKGAEQHDAHEFLLLFLDAVSNGSCFAIATTDQPDASQKAWQDSFAKKYSVVIGVFYGQTVSRLSCVQCGHRSETYEPFVSLGMEVSAGTLTLAFQKYLEQERVQYHCEKCRGSESLKKIDIVKWPKVLMITLKRFTAHQQKLTDLVTFDDTLVLNEHSYTLFGMVDHHGSCRGGHYTAQVRVHSQWYRCNDEVISKIDQPDPHSAYILFYRRI